VSSGLGLLSEDTGRLHNILGSSLSPGDLLRVSIHQVKFKQFQKNIPQQKIEIIYTLTGWFKSGYLKLKAVTSWVPKTRVFASLT
jgi:hypothetical protein